jgi:hypothetical protein
MKYLKNWKIFENSTQFNRDELDDIKSVINQYLLDLTDDDLDVKVLYYDDFTIPSFRVSIYNVASGYFHISKYKDNIENIVDYLDENGYELDYILTGIKSDRSNLTPKEILNKCINSNENIDLLDLFFEQRIKKLEESHSKKNLIDGVKDTLLEISDDESYDIKFQEFTSYKKGGEEEYLEINISRDKEDPVNIRRTKRVIPGAPVPPGGEYPSNLFLWFEIKDAIIRLCEWVYQETEYTPGINSKIFNDLRNESNSPFRMFNGGVEFGIGWKEEEDFTLGDFISFTNLKILIRL